MCFKVTSPSEEFFVVRARFLPCVDHIMSFEVARLREELVTVRTIVRFITCVDNFMLFKVTRQQE